MTTIVNHVPDPTKAIQRTRLLIHGEWVDAADGAEFDVYNPSTGQVFTRVSEAGPEDVNRAVESSRRAFEEGSWRNMTPLDRSAALWRLGDLLLEHADEIGRVETLDQGQPFQIARHGSVPSAAHMFHYMSGWATKIEGNTIPISAGGDFHVYTSG